MGVGPGGGGVGLGGGLGGAALGGVGLGGVGVAAAGGVGAGARLGRAAFPPQPIKDARQETTARTAKRPIVSDIRCPKLGEQLLLAMFGYFRSLPGPEWLPDFPKPLLGSLSSSWVEIARKIRT